MEIRRLESLELDALLELYRHLHPADDPLPERAQVEAAWAGIVDNPAFACFGVFDGADLVGSCTLVIVPNLTRGCHPYALIENVVMHPGFRRRGLGRAVVTRALDEARQAGCYKVMLMSGRKSAEVSGFYTSLGFDPNAKQAFLFSIK
jgi:GNAT superfamily N-acetyltransferase